MNKDIQSIILVEGTSDEWFIQSLLNYIKSENSIITTDVQHIHLDKIFGSSQTELTNKLNSLKTDFRNKPIKRIGIILDMDDKDNSEKVTLINNSISKSGILVPPFTEDIHEVVYPINSVRNISISYYIINHNGKGNVETLLSEIITADPQSANCLKAWKECSTEKGVRIKESDFLKEWIKIYLRYDYCIQNKLHTHAGDYCTVETSLKNIDKQIPSIKAWNFDAPILEHLKSYLKGFL